MASPQVENGHTKIANELVEALARVNLSAYETRIVWVILRKTYGWNKKSDRISYSQYQDATGIDRRHIGRAIMSLKEKNIITITGEGYSLEYAIQKDYDLWDLTPKEATIIDTHTGNDLTPKEAIVGQEKSLPIQGELTPIQGESLPKEVSKSLPKEANTKAIKHIQKHITKASPTFEEFLQLKIKEYPDLDVLAEWESCKLWWSEGKKPIQKPMSALSNWLKVAVEKKKKLLAGSQNGKYSGYSQKDSPHYPTTEELIASAKWAAEHGTGT